MSTTDEIRMREAFATMRISGKRFEGGQLPIETLEELLRYRDLILAASEVRWRQENEGITPPEELRTSLDLVLGKIEQGSACPLIVLPVETEFSEYFEQAKDDVDKLLLDLTQGDLDTGSFPNWANIDSLWDLGETLKPAEEMSIPAAYASESKVAVISTVTRAAHFEQLKENLNSAPSRVNVFAKIQGKVISLNAQKKNFEIVDARERIFKCRFRSDQLIDSLKGFIDEESKAPTVVIAGRAGLKDGELEKFHEVSLVADDADGLDPTLRRLEMLSQGGATDELQVPRIGVKLATAATSVLMAILTAELQAPAVFPTEEGGVLFEWASAESVHSIEVVPTGGLILYELPKDVESGTEYALDSVAELPDHLTRWKGSLATNG